MGGKKEGVVGGKKEGVAGGLGGGDILSSGYANEWVTNRFPLRNRPHHLHRCRDESPQDDGSSDNNAVLPPR